MKEVEHGGALTLGEVEVNEARRITFPELADEVGIELLRFNFRFLWNTQVQVR